MTNKILFLFFLSLLLASCSSSPDIRPGTLSSIPIGNKVDLKNSKTVKNKLYAQLNEWKGTEYEMGGLDKDGVDCSGFVYNTFRTKLGINIPRSTELQITTGKTVSKDKLRAGDLVFFKTSKKVRHVGIYIEKNKFLHASTSKGVMISKLNNVYWKSKFLKAKRL
ncbi:MAG: NlpC/P60 family protein [Gammaproteobacteria bacterium]|nr:NlpC/P60 family protein [Gammaproteobacteria bacterium]